MRVTRECQAELAEAVRQAAWAFQDDPRHAADLHEAADLLEPRARGGQERPLDSMETELEEIDKKVRQGMTTAQAIREVATKRGKSEETVKRSYYRNSKKYKERGIG